MIKYLCADDWPSVVALYEGGVLSSAEPHSEERRSRYCFGGFTLDLESGLLSRGGEEIALRPKSFEVLAYLVDRHGRLVSRDELMRAVWRDVAVTDESVTKCIADIRKALDDDSQQLIRTVARRGYLFNIPVTTPIAGFPRQAGSAVAEPRPVRVPTSASSQRILKRRNTAGAIALVALAVLAALLMHRTRPAKQ